jgi:hypothetical protein
MKKEYGVLCFRSAQLLYIVAYQWKGFYHSLDWFDFIDLYDLPVSFENPGVWGKGWVLGMYDN